MPKPNIAVLIVEQLVTLRHAVFINENGKLFLQALLASRTAATQRSVHLVDDALPHNTVEVWERVGKTWKRFGHARMTGDGGAEFVRDDGAATFIRDRR